jgi:DNA-binding NarL/FixJ family response regulator
VGVVIVAGAGIGKTRLARHVVEAAAEHGAFTNWVQATRSSAEVPLGAFAGLLPLESRSDNEAAFIHDFVADLLEQADGREIVMGVDDAQLLDSASAALLLHVAESSVAFLIVTIRSGERCPDAVTALWKDLGAPRLELGALCEEDLARLLEAALDGPVERSAHRWLAQSSRGNVLYAQQLVVEALNSGALVRPDGMWRMTRHPPLSASLQELLSARMGELAGTEREGLELLAIGEPIQLTEFLEVAGTDTLAKLETHRLVQVESPAQGGGEVRISHPLFGELVATQMPVSRGRAHRLRLAGLLAARPERSRDDVLRRATWLTDAGELVPTGLLLEAAWAASLAGGEFGSRFAQQALEQGAGPEANMVLARGHTVHGRAEDAEALLAPVEGQFEDPERALEYLRQRATGLQWGLGRGEEAVALLDRALGWWPEEEWQRRVGILHLQTAALVEAPGTMSAMLEQASADELLDAETRRWARRALAVDRLWAGRVIEGEALVADMQPEMPLRGALDFLEFATRPVVGLASGADLDGLQKQMQRSFDAALDATDHAATGLAAFTLAATSYLTGRFLDARRWLNEAIAEAEREDPFGTRALARSLQAGVWLALGEHELATDAADQLEREAVTPQHRGVLPWIARGRAWGQLASAEPPQAQRILLAAADELDWAPVYDAELRYEAMRAGRPARDIAPALERLRAHCDAPLTAAYTAHVTARASGDPAAMLTASDIFAGLGAALYASESAAHASAAFAAEGREDSARRAAARSRQLLPVDQGAQAMKIDGLDATAIELTPREAQLVELAARGLSNAQIADRLVLSTRTVETHLYRAMRKLGVSDRRELSRLA